MPQSFAEQLRSIPMSPSLGQSLERAHRSARDQSHRFVTLEHLLLALTEDAEAGLILQAANVDLARLGTDVSGYLGRLMEDMRAEPGWEPRPDGELLRVLQAAASAAQQSRRRQIDGAIVLAAVVGDGKSPAAGLLKALGMTFEEAIRALQRANTRARLKPLVKPSSASPAEASLPPAPVGGEPQNGRELPVTQPAPASAQPPATQSADEILAAARARIQKRSLAGARAEGALSPEPPSAPFPSPTPPAQVADTEPPIEAVDPSQTTTLTAAIEAAMTSPPSPTHKAEPRLPPTVPSGRPQSDDLPPPAPVAPPPPVAPRGAWTPAPEVKADPQAPRLSSLPAVGRAPAPPFPARPVQQHEGPRRPPLPGLGAPAPPQAGLPARAPNAPRPEADERAPSGRPPRANGSYGEFPALAQHVPERPDLAQRRAVPQRGGTPGEKGLLIEAVPRRMRVGTAASAEVRIARDKIDGLLLALRNRDGQVPGEAPVVRALSVRLKGTKGGFWIEPTTPETQWVEGQRARADDDHIVWRWMVVPRRRGRSRLTVMVTVNTAGRDGVVATTSPPDRVIDVSVGLDPRWRAARVAGWILAGLAGAALARFGPQYWPLVSALVTRTLGS
ncbi:MAG TPA: Clp protease N-terminal domain-containing protein [Hyphomicrobiaceae bacterium]|nr:Clp protease N-terminal domain-containing protein [Hyphomicrobiaceae bacterium]